MAFSETLFPEYISEGSSGGPSFNTDVIILKSGFEARNANWSQCRFNYDVSTGINDVAEYEDVLNIFLAMNGRAQGFLFKDPLDNKSCSITSSPSATDITIGNGDGATSTFQLIKNYTSGFTYQRTIYKPVSATTLISINDVAYTGGWTVDTTTGIVTFADITKTITNAVDNGGGVTRITTSANHTLSANVSVYLTAFTGDWSALNNSRYVVTVVDATNFDISEDSSGFTAYSSNGGQIDTLPQTGETVKAGFEFYVPVRFDTDQMTSNYLVWQLAQTQIPLVEIRI